MDTSFQHSPEFFRMLTGAPSPDLARIALEIASDLMPNIDRESYLRWIDNLSLRIRERCPSGSNPLRIIKQINWAMFIEEGFHGNHEDYFNPSNSYLNHVIELRTGIPITLCILYSAVAERLGLELAGMNFPAHFMLKFESPEETLFIDPFHGDLLNLRDCERRLSKILQRRIHLGMDQTVACSRPMIIARMLRNLKALLLQSGDSMTILPLQLRLAAILADVPQEQRDLGLLYLQLGLLDQAVQTFQSYLDRWSREEDASSITLLLLETRREISLRN